MRQKLTTHISRAYFRSAKQNINTELYYNSLTKLQMSYYKSNSALMINVKEIALVK